MSGHRWVMHVTYKTSHAHVYEKVSGFVTLLFLKAQSRKPTWDTCPGSAFLFLTEPKTVMPGFRPARTARFEAGTRVGSCGSNNPKGESRGVFIDANNALRFLRS